MLLIDPDVTAAAAVAEAISPALDLEVRSDFTAARALLIADPPRLLVTALRLREYNGLHLVYLAARGGLQTRSVVYTDVPDPGAARETRTAGAFYECRQQLVWSLPSYATAALPDTDRRGGTSVDRRRLLRGGRRAYDQRRSVSLTF